MSEIKVDTLTGKTSAGDITVTSEGGAATMQLQQGLAKVWQNLDGSGTISTRDSSITLPRQLTLLLADIGPILPTL